MKDSKNNGSAIRFIKTQEEDIDNLQTIRAAAFQPIFDSFRNILGEVIYKHAQAPSDEAQEDYLKDLFEEDSIWETWKMDLEEKTIGFISIRIDEKTKVGEIGLNAIHPKYSSKGFGAQMYHFALEQMKKAGMKVATVSTGGDPAHLPARKAYKNVGFDVEISSVWMCQVLE